MSSSGVCRRVVHIRTDISEERVASIIRAEKISELGITLAVTSKTNVSKWPLPSSR
jgi:hypothetical protein